MDHGERLLDHLLDARHETLPHTAGTSHVLLPGVHQHGERILGERISLAIRKQLSAVRAAQPTLQQCRYLLKPTSSALILCVASVSLYLSRYGSTSFLENAAE